ncbi:protein MARD1-like [Lolium rigidum]|uniref:protein MARD1-like n=1 Tax=Lolium rigidum TaxID=89674 RepID=UPI001F5C2083|nr:protein MARD1-like [Lolium rigidum]
MFLRSKVQEMILRRRSRSTNGAQHAGDPPPPAPRLLHSASLPAGSCATAGSPQRDSYSMSPTSVLDASASFASPAADGGSISKRRPWCDGCAGPHGLADALDCAHDGRERRRSILAGRVKAQAPALVRSCSLDRRVEFGVKNKSSWLPLRAGGRAAHKEEAAPAPDEVEMEPSSEDYTCVISRGPNPRTVHIFGDRVVEDDHRETSPRQIANMPPAPTRGDRGFLSL